MKPRPSPSALNSITADYVTDGNFAASDSDAVAVTVAATSNTATSVNYSPAAPVYGESVTLSASVTPTSATGTVAFYNGTKLLGTETLSDGTATYDATTLVLGGNTISAVYPGDSNDTSSTSTDVTVTVQQASTTTAVTYFPTSPVSGQTVTLTATIGRSPTSSEFTSWDKQLNAGRSLKSVVAAIVASPAAALYRIQSAFQEYLGQEGTSEQIRSVLASAEATHTIVRAAILGSSEFYQKSGGTLAGYQATLETAVLGTTIDQPVLKAQLASGVSRTVVAEEVLQSDNGKQSLLVAAYQGVMGSAPSGHQITTYVGLMNDGVYLRTIVASLLASTEYYNSATASISNS